MIDLYRSVVSSQYVAALMTLRQCIDDADEAVWVAEHPDGAVNRVVFHALFYADLYLCRSEHDVKRQPYHLDHPEFFKDYEELEDREAVNVYPREASIEYLEFCIQKARKLIATETEATLAGPSGFSWRPEPRAELHIYNIRHIQHHAAQLGLRGQLRGLAPLRWVSHG